MNADALRDLWWPSFGLLAVESALVIGVAALCGRLVQPAIWRRTIWQGCIVTVLALVTIELGAARAWISGPSPASSPTERPLNLSVWESGFTQPGARPAKAGTPSDGASTPLGVPPSGGRDAWTAEAGPERIPERPIPASTRRDTQAVAEITPASAIPYTQMAGARLFGWALILWAAGTLLLLAKSFFSRLLLVLIRLRSTPIQDRAHLERLEVLSARMNLRRQVSLFESERLTSPVACGVARPAVGLPPQFTRIHNPTRRDVMLVHELAHLKAGDPAWYWVADVVVALLWWQPLIWWMRRRLHAASECAADEASLLVTDGPGVLAECLVELGQRLTHPRPTGWLGVEGGDFRSGLGRRVERLLNLDVRSWQPPKRIGSALARTLAPAALIAVVVLATAWTLPQTSTERDSMKNPFWKKSMTALGLMSALGVQTTSTTAADTNPLPRPAVVTTEVGPGAGGGGGRGGGGNRLASRGGDGGQQPLEVHQAGPTAVVPGSGAKGQANAKLKAKLDSIILDEVSYDCLPLDQVVDNLIQEAMKRDPNKTGVNFLMGKATETSSLSVDPATGLPITSVEQVDDLSATTICIRPPLRKVRLTDVLDAITRVADRPVKYSIEEYAVVWTPATERTSAALRVTPAPPVTPQVRAYKLDTNVFIKSLQKAFNVQADGDSAEVREILWKHVFPRVGLHLESETSALFYNEVTGVLLVRATPEAHAIIQPTVETLGGKLSTSESASTSIKR